MGLAATCPPVPLAQDTDDIRALAKSIAFYALSLLIQDTKSLIRKALTKKIKQDSINPNQHIQTHAKKRLDALHKWEHTTFLLSWNTAPSASSHMPGGYTLLLIILNDDHNSALRQLTHSKHQLSYKQLAQCLIDMASSQSQSILAPLLPHSPFTNALSLTIKFICKCTPHNTAEENFCVHIFSLMMKNMNIHFLPWHHDDTGRGSPRVTQHNWWMIINCNLIITNTNHQIQQVIDLTLEEEMQSVASSVAQNNPTAPGEILTRLADMHTLWKKKVLPDNWNFKHASLDHTRTKSAFQYVWKTYEWVQKIMTVQTGNIIWLSYGLYSSQGLLHISFSQNHLILINTKDLTHRIRHIPWIQGSSSYHKGITAAKPYITMLSTAIIALCDPHSPLSIHATANKNSLGLGWTDKHGQCSSLLLFTLVIHIRSHSLLIQGNKEINAINLIRIGLAQAKTPDVINLAKYKSNWDMSPDNITKPLYEKVMTYLLDKRPFGEYFAMDKIFGQQVANRLANAGEIIALPGAIQFSQKIALHIPSQPPDAMDVDIDDNSMYLSN